MPGSTDDQTTEPLAQPTTTLLNRHQAFIQSRLPAPLKHPGSACLKTLVSLEPSLPAWYSKAAPALRAAFENSQQERCTSQHELDTILGRIVSLEAFAEPLLKQAIRTEFGQEVDVKTTYFVRRMQGSRPSNLYGLLDFSAGDPRVRTWYWGITLLEAALHNFSADEADKPPAEGREFISQDRHTNAIRMISELPIRPERFARLCRALDLGRQYQAHINAVLNPVDAAQKARVRQTWVRHMRHVLSEAVHLARMKGDVAQDTYEMLIQWLEDRPDVRLDGHPVEARQLRMLGVDLSELLLIGPQRGGGAARRCVVYVPGDELHPIREYSSSGAFMIELRARLHGAKYRRFFGGFVSVREQASFFSALKKRLDHADEHEMWDDYTLDPGLRVGLELDDFPLRAQAGDSLDSRLRFLCEQMIRRRLGDARALAVPTDDEDRDARIARFMGFFDAAMDVLNLLVFVPGLGQVMLLAMATRMLHEVYSGIEAWEAGETREAWAHLLGVAMNVAFIGGAGVVLPHIDTSAFVDGLVPVSVREGVMRLWKPDLRPYEHLPSLPSGSLPDELGLHDYLDDRYLPLEGRHYRLEPDEQWPGLYRARHAATDDLLNPYAPAFHSNGAGGWVHELEAPLDWDDARLFARLGPDAAGLDGKAAQRILDICGVDADVLRAVHHDSQPPPALLGDTVTRFVLDRELGRLVHRLQAGGASSGSLDELHMEMQLLTSDPVWPRSKVLQLVNEQGLTLQEYPTSPDATLPRIEIRWPGLEADGLLEQVLRRLDEGEIRTLLQEEFGVGQVSLSSRVTALRRRLAGEAVKRRTDLFDSHYRYRTDSGSDAPGVRVLRRDFPGLPVGVARELAAEADALESQRLEGGRVPLRLAEEARYYLRNVRLVRAYESVYLDSVDQKDAYRLVPPMLEKLPGWSSDVRLEIRDGTFQGPLLASVGPQRASISRVLISDKGLYEACDEIGLDLHGPDDLYAAILHALPDAERTALGINVGEGAKLREALRGLTPLSREELTGILKLPAIKPGFRSPMRLADGRVGYPLGGSKPGSSAKPALPSYRTINKQHLDEWVKMSQEERDDLTLAGFARRHNLDPRRWKAHVRKDGHLGSYGEALWLISQGHEFAKITDEDLWQWQQLSEQESNSMTSKDFVVRRNLNPVYWEKYVGPQKGFSNFGLANIERWKKTNQPAPPTEAQLQAWRDFSVTTTRPALPVPSGRSSKPAGPSTRTIEKQHLDEWVNMSQQERDNLSIVGFARKRHLNPNTLKNHVRKDGHLTPSGEAFWLMLQGHEFATITDEDLWQWQQLSEQESNSMTSKDFAVRRNLNPAHWEKYMGRETGFSESGLANIERWKKANQPAPPTPKDLQAWRDFSVATTRPALPVPPGRSSEPAGHVFRTIEKRHLDEWVTMLQSERDNLTVEQFAQKHELNPIILRTYVGKDGHLKPPGEAFWLTSQGHEFATITDEHLWQWQQLSEQEGNSLTSKDFVARRNLNPANWERYVGRKKGLTRYGLAKIERWKKIKQPAPPTEAELQAWRDFSVATTRPALPVPSGRSSKPAGPSTRAVEKQDLEKWLGMSQTERENLTKAGFVEKYNLSPSEWKKYVRIDGSLRAKGEGLWLTSQGHEFATITDEDLWQWQQLSEQESNSMTWKDFVTRRNLNPASWEWTVSGGLSKAGKKRLDGWRKKNQPAPPTPKDLLSWRDFSVTTARPALPVPTPSAGSSTGRPPLARKGTRPAKRPAQAAETEESPKHPRPSSPEVTFIKPEPGEGQASRPRHEIDNTLPILQDPTDPHRSVLLEAEGPIDKITVTKWSGLRDVLNELRPVEQKKIKREIKRQVRDWLSSEGRHAERFDEILEIGRLVDEGPSRGDGVVAKRDIARFEVLGPYAGKLHETQATLDAEILEYGEHAVSTYLFATRSRDRVVSGYRTGNILSLVNTAKLPGAGTAWKHNNVEAIEVGKNLTFYVAREDILAGTELLMDYGANYDPDQGRLPIKPEPSGDPAE